MLYAIPLILFLMGVMYLLRITDGLRVMKLADYRVPMWMVFTPIVLPVFLFGLATVLYIYATRFYVSAIRPR